MSPYQTGVLVILLFTAIIVFDVYLAADGRKGNTYSEVVRKWGKAWPPLRLLISFGMGLLMGHWYW